MGNRLTKIYTRTGDQGETGMAGGGRVAKDSVVIHAIGDVDELNCILGLLACKVHAETELASGIKLIQNELFDLGGELSSSHQLIGEQTITRLEQRLDQLNEGMPELKEFILPGGGEAGSLCHMARSVCRRAERQLVAASREQEISPVLLAYINRLSDLLFVMARYIAKQNGEPEVYWQSRRVNSEK